MGKMKDKLIAENDVGFIEAVAYNKALERIAELGGDLRRALDLLQAMLNKDGNGGLDWNEPALKGTVGWEIRELVKKYKGRVPQEGK